MRRHLLLAHFLTTPLAVRTEWLPLAYSVLSRWDAGAPPSDTARAQVQDDKTARDASRESMQAESTALTAVLPLMGVLTQHPVEDISGPGATSIDRWAAKFQTLVESPSIKKIIVPMEGPGGSVFGIQEAADLIYQARTVKPVIGLANSYAASGHYWLLSQMTEAWVTPGGEVGSIGVRCALVSLADQLKADGIDYRIIASSPYKAEGDPSQPITDEGIAALQSRVADYDVRFVEAVARGRGVSPDYVRAEMGQGRMLRAEAAKASKMVDGIATFRDLIARHTAGQPPAPAGRNSRRRAAAEIAIATAA